MMNSQTRNSNLSALCAILLCATIISTVLLSGSEGGNLVNFVATAAFACVATATALLERKRFRFFPEITLLIIWLCYSLLPSMGAEAIDLAITRVRQMVQIIVLVLVSVNVMLWYGRTSVFTIVYFASALLAYFAALTGFGFGIIDESILQEQNAVDRVVGTHGNANQFGMVCLQAQFAAAFFVVQSRNTIPRLAGGVVIAILGVAILNSGSRTALIGMVIFVLGFLWVFRVWKIRYMGRAILIVGIVGLLSTGTFLALLQNDDFETRVDSYLENEDIMSRYEVLLNPLADSGDSNSSVNTVDGSTSARAELISAAWHSAIRKPLGIGLDNFKVLAENERLAENSYAHSNHFELLATTGFPGLALFMAIYVFMLRRSLSFVGDRSAANTLARLFAVCIAALMITDIANVSYYDKPYWLFIALAIASMELARQTRTNQALSDEQTQNFAYIAR